MTSLLDTDYITLVQRATGRAYVTRRARGLEVTRMPQYAFELPEALVQAAQRDGSPAHAREPAEGERTKRSMTL